MPRARAASYHARQSDDGGLVVHVVDEETEFEYVLRDPSERRPYVAVPASIVDDARWGVHYTSHPGRTPRASQHAFDRYTREEYGTTHADACNGRAYALATTPLCRMPGDVLVDFLVDFDALVGALDTPPSTPLAGSKTRGPDVQEPGATRKQSRVGNRGARQNGHLVSRA